MSFVNIASTSIFPLELLRRSLLSSPSSTLGAQRQQLSKTSGRIASFLCKCFQRQNRAKKRDPRTISCSVRCNPILDFVGSLIFCQIQRFPLLQTQECRLLQVAYIFVMKLLNAQLKAFPAPAKPQTSPAVTAVSSKSHTVNPTKLYAGNSPGFDFL